MTREELTNNSSYYVHHTAYTRVYVRRTGKLPAPQPYEGKFGKGYTLLSPNWGSTRYSLITYVIERESSHLS